MMRNEPSKDLDITPSLPFSHSAYPSRKRRSGQLDHADNVIGTALNLEARLQTLAEPNTVVILESTRRQVGSLFRLRSLGPLLLKGFAHA